MCKHKKNTATSIVQQQNQTRPCSSIITRIKKLKNFTAVKSLLWKWKEMRFCAFPCIIATGSFCFFIYSFIYKYMYALLNEIMHVCVFNVQYRYTWTYYTFVHVWVIIYSIVSRNSWLQISHCVQYARQFAGCTTDFWLFFFYIYLLLQFTINIYIYDIVYP